MEIDFGVDFCQKFDDVFRTLLNPTLSIKDDTILERLLELVVKFLNQVEVHHGATQPIAIGGTWKTFFRRRQEKSSVFGENLGKVWLSS